MNHLAKNDKESFTYKYETFFFDKTKKNKKKTNSVFLSISKFIASYFTTLTEDQKVINELIEHKSWNLIGTMIENGYRLTPKQLGEINKVYAHALEDKDHLIENVAQLLEYKLPFTQDSMHNLFFHSYIQIYLRRYMQYHEDAKYLTPEVLSKKYYHTDFKPIKSSEYGIYSMDTYPPESSNKVLTKIYEYLDNPNAKKALFANWLELVLTDKKFSDRLLFIEPYNIFKHDLIPTLSLEQYNKLILCFNKFPNTEERNLVLEDLNNNIKDIFQNKVEHLINNIKKVEVTKTETLSHLPAQEINLSTQVELPDAAKIILTSIHDNYKNLNKDKENLINCWNEIEIIMSKHVPLIIKKYSAIDPNYRENLNNAENKNAQEILIASLSNINLCFEEKLKECNQNRLHDLSASHKYTKQLLKNPK